MLYAFTGAFAIGVAAGSLGTGTAWAFFFALLAGALFSYLRFIVRESKLSIVPLVMLGLALGLGRAALVGSDSSLDPYLGETVEIRGFVAAEPDIRETHTRLIIDGETLRLGDAATSTESRILASVEHYPAFDYGDEVVVAGKLERPESFDTGAGREFNYPAFLAKDGIYYEMKFSSAELLSRGNACPPSLTLRRCGRGNLVKEKLFAFKNFAIGRTARVIPEPESSLLAGILFGSKRSLGDETLDAFKVSGITHIIVLSGFNIAIIAAFASRLFSRLPRMWGFGASALSIALFAVMTGATASIVRASLMALLVLLARGTGRTYGAFRALMIAGFAMLVHNPLILLFDPGFQLSFIATLGLILLSPIVEKKLTFVTEKWNAREMVVSTLSAQIFVLPLLLYMTGNFSIVSFPVNILVLPAVPAAMFAGFATTVAAFVSPVLALVPGLVAYAFLSYILLIGENAARLPYAAVPVPALPFFLVALWYALYVAAIRKFGGFVKKNEENENAASRANAKFDVSGAYEIVG